jgi:hypothetical protein
MGRKGLGSDSWWRCADAVSPIRWARRRYLVCPDRRWRPAVRMLALGSAFGLRGRHGALRTHCHRVETIGTRLERSRLLIQGVHVETISFSSYADACEIARTPGWPWLGEAGPQGSREINLGGVPPRRVRLRVSDAQARGHSTVCSIELLEVDRLFTSRIQIELTLQPNSSGTRLTINGLFARDIAGDPNSHREVSRHLANECVRSLIEKVADEIERLKGGSEPTRRPRVVPQRKQHL